MQLRLAAESGVETAAAQIERYAVPNVGERTRVDVDGVPMAAGIELHVYIERSRERSGREFLDVIAAAVDRAGTRIPDGEDWTRAKTVRGRMEKKGDRYVWRRWY